MICQGHECNQEGQEQLDAYGITTGIWCDKCYNDDSIYPYHKDEYFDPAYAGERLEEDY